MYIYVLVITPPGGINQPESPNRLLTTNKLTTNTYRYKRQHLIIHQLPMLTAGYNIPLTYGGGLVHL